MPAKARTTNDGQHTQGEQARSTASIADRIAAFTMLDGMREATQAQKCFRLALVGFSHAEIAEMLQTSAAVVAQGLYTERRKVRPSGRVNRKKMSPKSSAREPV